MEAQLNLEPVQSLVPVLYVQPVNTLSHKYWHIICRAEFIVPHGLQAIKISVFLVWYDHHLYLTVVFEFIPMLSAPQANLDFPSFVSISENECNPCIPLHGESIPLSYGVFQLPNCPQCYLGLQCHEHKNAEH